MCSVRWGIYSKHEQETWEKMRLLREIHEAVTDKPLDKQLAPQLRGVLEDAVHVMQNPPATWHDYLKRHDYAGVAHMEGKELETALLQRRPSSEVRKELVHTIAALMLYAQ